ncbi:MAG: hypothetical protein R3322_00005, partial [Kiloniellales bacterium]|nr:hypothetical protein [Kiloniellales bacterium]
RVQLMEGPVEKLDDLAFVLNTQRQALPVKDTLRQMLNYRKLYQDLHGKSRGSQKYIAEQLGLTESQVSRRLKPFLANQLTAEAEEAAKKGHLTWEIIEEMARVPLDKQPGLLKKILSKKDEDPGLARSMVLRAAEKAKEEKKSPSAAGKGKKTAASDIKPNKERQAFIVDLMRMVAAAKTPAKKALGDRPIPFSAYAEMVRDWMPGLTDALPAPFVSIAAGLKVELPPPIQNDAPLLYPGADDPGEEEEGEKPKRRKTPLAKAATKLKAKATPKAKATAKKAPAKAAARKKARA